MVGIKLRTTAQGDYVALGTEGTRVYSVSEQLRAAVRRRLNTNAADIFAIPRPSDKGDTIEWFAPMQGHVVPWSAASEEEKQQAQLELMQVRAKLLDYATQMAKSENRQEQHFGKLLEKSMHIPDENHIYLVSGRPVLTCWGLASQSMRMTGDIIPNLMTMASYHAPYVAVPEMVVGAERTCRPWWLRPLSALLLLLLLAWLAYRHFLPQLGVSVTLPGLENPVAEQLVLPRDETIREAIPVDEARRRVQAHDVDGGMVVTNGQTMPGRAEEGGGDGAEEAAPAINDETTATEDVAPAEEMPSDTTKLEEAGSLEQQPDSESPPTPDKTAADALGNNKPTEQQPIASAKPLTIPEGTLANGKTDFLDGHWKSTGGLMDQQTGKPIKVDYDFKDGKGEARITRPDGTVCKGAASPDMVGGTLTIKGGGAIGCTDGTHYVAPDFACVRSGNGNTTCQGVDAQGQKYPVRINRTE